MGRLALEGVKKSFGGVDVIRGVDLDIRDGEFVVMVGPSGCGKSTLLRLIAGLEAVTAGRITIDGRDVTALEPVDRRLAMVFQSYALYPHMTVRGNMAFGLETARVPKPEIDAKVAEKKRAMEEFRMRANIVSGERDENQALSRVKGLGTSLTAATDREAVAEGRLRALEQAAIEGKRDDLFG